MSQSIAFLLSPWQSPVFSNKIAPFSLCLLSITLSINLLSSPLNHRKISVLWTESALTTQTEQYGSFDRIFFLSIRCIIAGEWSKMIIGWIMHENDHSLSNTWIFPFFWSIHHSRDKNPSFFSIVATWDVRRCAVRIYEHLDLPTAGTGSKNSPSTTVADFPRKPTDFPAKPKENRPELPTWRESETARNLPGRNFDEIRLRSRDPRRKGPAARAEWISRRAKKGQPGGVFPVPRCTWQETLRP